MSGEFIFVNGTRLRLDLDNYAAFSHVLSIFRVSGIGDLHAGETVTARDWQVFLALAQSVSDVPPHDRLFQVLQKLEAAGVTAFTLAAPAEDTGEDRERAKERAKRTYAQSVAVTKDLMTSLRMGKSPNIKKIKRVVQGIVDQILNEGLPIGLTSCATTTIHVTSVNVCVSRGARRRLGSPRSALRPRACALLPDTASRACLWGPDKTGALPRGLESARSHPGLGLSIFAARLP